MQNITITTKYFVNLIKVLDSMIILLQKSRFQEMGNNAFYVFFLKLLFMDNIHYYIYICRNISELFDCSVFKRQLS